MLSEPEPKNSKFSTETKILSNEDISTEFTKSKLFPKSFTKSVRKQQIFNQFFGHSTELQNRINITNNISATSSLLPINVCPIKCGKLSKQNLTVFYANVRSLSNKLNEFKSAVFENDYDICVINESWLKTEIPNKHILENYDIYRNDRQGRGGGVLIAVKNHYKSIIKFKSDTYEDIFAEVYVDKFKLLLGTLYKPPQMIIDYDKYLNTYFRQIDINFYDCICILGDFNTDFLDFTKRETKELNEVMISNGFVQMIEKPTYPAICPKSTIDLFFTNNRNFINDIVIRENISKSCDHKGISF